MRLGAAAFCLALCGCDSVHALFSPRARAAGSRAEVVLGPWLLEPGASEVTVAWTTAQPVTGRVWYNPLTWFEALRPGRAGKSLRNS